MSDNKKCGPDCTHTYSEHRAFDKGFEWGKKYQAKTTNTYDLVKQPKEHAACEHGIQAGFASAYYHGTI